MNELINDVNNAINSKELGNLIKITEKYDRYFWRNNFKDAKLSSENSKINLKKV